MRVCDSLRSVSCDAWSHSSRTATRAVPLAVNDRLKKSSCSSSASRRRTVASSTSDSSSPRSARAQSTRATGVGTRAPREQRRTASAAATGSSVQSPPGRRSWPIVASSLWSGPGAAPSSPTGPPRAPGPCPPPVVPPPVRSPPGTPASPDGPSRPCPSAACTVPRRTPGSPSHGPCAATATTADTTTSRATYSITPLPRSTVGLLSLVGSGAGSGPGAGPTGRTQGVRLRGHRWPGGAERWWVVRWSQNPRGPTIRGGRLAYASIRSRTRLRR